MKRNNSRYLLGALLAATLAASTATLGLSACVDYAADCQNTRTCEPPACIEAGDAKDRMDGC